MKRPPPISKPARALPWTAGPGMAARGLAELIAAHAAQEARFTEAIARRAAPGAGAGTDAGPEPKATGAAPRGRDPGAAPGTASGTPPGSAPGTAPGTGPARRPGEVADGLQGASPDARDAAPPGAEPLPSAAPVAPAAPPQAPPPGAARPGKTGGPAPRRPEARRAAPPLFGEFRSMVAPAPPPGSGPAPTGPDDGAQAAQPPVTEIDSEINVLKLQMHMAELDVLDHPPRDRHEALLKLRFLAGMFDSGGQVEPGMAGALIRECAALLDPATGPP